jgi:threonine/homoserine/homoserine lactone efflux protein
MFDVPTFALAVLGLLAVPGPTNTLLAASGAAAGVGRSLRLIPAELVGYGLSIGLLAMAAGPVVAAQPLLAAALKTLAGVYLVVCALRLWRSGGAALARTPAPAGVGRVFVTTLLNPKGLVFAFAIFPADPAALPLAFALFAAILAAVSLGWIAAGAALAGTAGAVVTPARVSRAAALVLGLFAAALLSNASAAFGAAALHAVNYPL